MNRQFLEFWGKALLMAAQSQKHLEDLARWQQQGFLMLQEYLPLFKACYGLEGTAADSADFFTLWHKAEEDFRRSFRDFLNLLGVVPREEYADLARRYAELQKKVAEQEETISQLRRLAEDKGMGLEATSLELQKLIKKQGEEFQKFLQGLGESVQAKDNNP